VFLCHLLNGGGDLRISKDRNAGRRNRQAGNHPEG